MIERGNLSALSICLSMYMGEAEKFFTISLLLMMLTTWITESYSQSNLSLSKNKIELICPKGT